MIVSVTRDVNRRPEPEPEVVIVNVMKRGSLKKTEDKENHKRARFDAYVTNYLQETCMCGQGWTCAACKGAFY